VGFPTTRRLLRCQNNNKSCVTYHVWSSYVTLILCMRHNIPCIPSSLRQQLQFSNPTHSPMSFSASPAFPALYITNWGCWSPILRLGRLRNQSRHHVQHSDCGTFQAL
jgi:hypothetical protein